MMRLRQYSILLTIISFFIGTSTISAFEMQCPPDKWVDCKAELWDLDIYGHARYKDYGGWHTLYHPKEDWNLNSCDMGNIIRTWEVKDPYSKKWFSCKQTIDVGYVGGKPNIWWPKEELELEGCDPSTDPDDLPYGYRRPEYSSGDCQMLVSSYKDEDFNFSNGCRKIIRRWTVIDWCQYVPNSSSKKGYYTYNQVFKIVNKDEPDVDVPDPVTVQTSNCKEVYVDVDDFKVLDSKCSGYTVVTNDSPHAIRNGKDASGYYPIGTTKITYKLKYACGRVKSYTTTVTVENKSAPSLLCIQSISTALMPVDTDGDGYTDDGMVAIWAKDFAVSGSGHPCGKSISYSFEKDKVVMSKEFTCADIGPNQIKVYAIDTDGNYSYCSALVNVQNNSAAIPGCGNEDTDDGNDDSDDDSNDSDTDTETDDSDGDDSTDDDSSDDEGYGSGAVLYGDVAMFYGMPVAAAEIQLIGNAIERMELELIDSILTYTITDSFYNDSGQLLYVTEFDYEYVYDTTYISSILEENVMTDQEGHYQVLENIMHQEVHVGAAMEHSTEDDIKEYINFEDALALYNHVNGTALLDNIYAQYAADLNDDGVIDQLDVNNLINFVSGNESLITGDEWTFFLDDAPMSDLESMQGKMDEMTKATETFTDFGNIQNFVAVRKGDIVNKGYLARSNSNLAKLSAANALSTMELYPNPFTNELRYNLNDVSSSGAAQFELYDLLGQKILDHLIYLETGRNTGAIPVLSSITPGTYIYKIESEALGLITGKILKQ